MGERLQSDGLRDVLGERAAEVVPVASHGERRCPDRTAEVEGEDLRLHIAAELHRHQSQKNALARAGRADDQGVPDVADVKGEAERRRTFGPREEERRRGKMRVTLRTRPDGGERHHMGEIERRNRRLTHVGVDVAWEAAKPGLNRVHGLAHAGEVAALDRLFDKAQSIVGGGSVLVPDGDRRADVAFADEVGAEFL